MKKFWAALFVVVAAVVLWRACARRAPEPVRTGKLTVVASGYVPYGLAKQIGGDKIDVSMLLPANAEPHSFEPTPGAIVAVNGADAFIYVSGRLEPWAKELLAGVKKTVRTVETGRPFEDDKDPHVWMSFANMGVMAAQVEKALAQQDPQNAAYYAANLEAFQKELSALDAEYTAALASCQSRDVVHVGHLAFGRLADSYGLKLQALAGSSHDGEQSVRNLARLMRFIKRNRVKNIFTEESVSPRLAQTVMRETGVTVLPLYTVEHVSKEDFDKGVTYTQFMRKNLDSLRRGLVCTR